MSYILGKIAAANMFLNSQGKLKELPLALGGAALGGLAGWGLTPEEHAGKGALFGALGGAGLALNAHITDDIHKTLMKQDNPLFADPIEGARATRQHFQQVSPTLAGAALGGTAGALYGGSDDPLTNYEAKTQAAILGAMAGGSALSAGRHYMDKLDDALLNKSMKRRMYWANEAAKPRKGTVVNVKEPDYLKLPTPKTAAFGSPAGAVAARTAFGTAAGGLGGYYLAPGLYEDQKVSPAEEKRRRIQGALIGALTGGTLSGGTKYLSQKLLNKHLENPYFEPLINDLNREFL